MNFLDALILGIVEGITEFLPVSSTGHLILTSSLLKLQSTEFLKSFEIAIQMGAILSVVVLYAKSLIRNREMLQKVIVAFLPTAILGLLAYKAIKHYLLGNEMVVIASLLIGGIILILFELTHKSDGKESSNITYTQAFVIGLFQSISMIPGVSRSAATILGGLFQGIDRKTVVEFSFVLAIPTMAAATGLDLLKSGTNFTTYEFELLLVGFVVSFVVAMFCVHWLLKYIQHHTFIPFGIYRIILALAFWFLM